MTRPAFVPDDWPSVVPRIVVADAVGLCRFVQSVFGATGEINTERPSELRIRDSILMISSDGVRDVKTAFLYVYVEDTDRVFELATAQGAKSIEAPLDTPYGDRRAMIEDLWGNTWQIATHGGRFTP
jgi:PhnB protein